MGLPRSLGHSLQQYESFPALQFRLRVGIRTWSPRFCRLRLFPLDLRTAWRDFFGTTSPVWMHPFYFASSGWNRLGTAFGPCKEADERQDCTILSFVQLGFSSRVLATHNCLACCPTKTKRDAFSTHTPPDGPKGHEIRRNPNRQR